MPKARREHGLRAIEAARKALAAQTAAGNDPRRSASVNRARSEAVTEGHRRNRSWAREHPGQRDEAWFRREIAPKLDAFTLAEIAAATGLSLAACSRIRAGANAASEALGGLAEADRRDGPDRRGVQGCPDGSRRLRAERFQPTTLLVQQGARQMNKGSEIDPEMDARAKECLRLYLAGDLDPSELVFGRPPTADQKTLRVTKSSNFLVKLSQSHLPRPTQTL